MLPLFTKRYKYKMVKTNKQITYLNFYFIVEIVSLVNTFEEIKFFFPIQITI